jgi:thiol-disulfide isomerase/thioredoxin
LAPSFPVNRIAAIATAAPAPPKYQDRTWGRRGVGFVASVLALALLTGSQAAQGGKEPLDAAFDRLEGGKLRLSEVRGGTILLELWATWCTPCKEQARILEELLPELSERGVSVLAVNIGEKPKVVSGYLEEHPKSVPVLLDRPQVLARLLDIAELPVLALLDADGRVAGVHLGLAQREEILDLLQSVERAPER